MDELQDLREHIEHGRYAEALVLIGELEEMGRDDKIQKIESFLQVLLVHLIKRQAERRTTRSWDVSIRNAADAIQRVNKRRRAGGHYLGRAELAEALDEILPSALRQASLEAFEGRHDDAELAGMVDMPLLRREALSLIAPGVGTRVEDGVGCTGYSAPAKSVAQMDAGIDAALRTTSDTNEDA